jgi:hypothetical protein
MGASGWISIVPYHEDPAAALAYAREWTFAKRDYYWPHDGRYSPALPYPDSLKGLLDDPAAQESGTHSVIDIETIAEDHDDLGAAVLLDEADVAAMFGSGTPTRADFERAEEEQHTLFWSLIPERYCAHYVVLYQDGRPNEIAFWGYSGD